MKIKLKAVSDYAIRTRDLGIGQEHKVVGQGVSQDENHRGKTFFMIQPRKGNLYCFYANEIEILKD